jgi:phytoene dehydrogenase-like protein
VVSNVDALTTFLGMVGPENLPASFTKNLRRVVPTSSAFSLYLATSLDVPRILGAHAHELFVFGEIDDRAAWAGNMRGEPGSLFASVTTAVDSSLAPPGEHLVIATAPAPYDPPEQWADANVKEKWTAEILRLLEQGIPGLRDNLTYMEAASPLAVERYSGAHKGAFLGWELNPIQLTSRRPHQRAPIKGLYLAGQWTYPGGGAIRVTVSGLQAAMLILGDLGMEDAVAALRPPDLAPES